MENASPREKAKLTELNAAFDDACGLSDRNTVRQADINLHLYIAGGYNHTTRSSVLFRMVKNSCLLSATIRSNCDSKITIGPIGVHDELVKALQSGDIDAAEQAGKAHVRGSLGFIESVLNQKYF